MKIKVLALAVLSILFLSSNVIAKQDKHKEKVKSLPLGLEKNMERGKGLPPGWQKKLKVGGIIEPNVYKEAKIIVPVDKDGLLTVEVGGKLVKLRDKTKEIIEILDGI